MRNILRFIYRYYFVLLFLFLETLALVMTVNRQEYQRSLYIHSANAVSGWVYGLQHSVRSYLSLQASNDQLIHDNLQLLRQQPASFLITDNQVFEYEDTLYRRRFEVLHAEVINNSITRRNNYLTLNKGRLHGIAPDMGVILPNGVVGIVSHTTDHFSSVMSLLHDDMRLSVQIKKNGHIGSLRWEGVDYLRATLGDVPPHVALSRGDTIVTSGYSTVFPEDVFIGVIEDWEVRRGEVFYSISVRLALDFNRLSHVYVVSNLMKEEQDAMEALENVDL